MCHGMTFIETSVFTRQIKELASDDDLRRLQEVLIALPTAGAVIPGTGGLRKIRVALGARGKRGGFRVIYYLADRDFVYLLLAYAKSVKENLNEAEKSVLKSLAKQLQEAHR